MRIPNILPMLLLAFSMSLAAQNAPCHIFDLKAEVVDCHNGEFYVKLNFQHENTGSQGFAVAGTNGVSYGIFSYSQLPVTIGPLPANGTTPYGFLVKDLVFPDCAADIGIGTVDCSTTAPCEIYDLVVITGDCNDDGTYVVKLNFKVENPTNDLFDLVGNGQVIGTYKLSELPLTINHFPNVGLTGYVKVCIKDNPDCCSIKQFQAPDCSALDPCKITDVKIQTGDCQPGGLYKLTLDFKVSGATNDLFEVWAGNGQYLGFFPLNQLPIGLPFPWGGGPVDKIRICINDNPDCCTVVEFQAPPCFSPCRIEGLSVEAGACTSDTTYEVIVKFQQSATSPVDSFSIWAGTGEFLGRFAVADMPIKLSHFPWGGGSVDAIKVCISNNCCRTKEFNVPVCLAPPCGIDDLKVDVGDCTSPKTYKLLLNFKVTTPTPTAAKFAVWADNGDFLGTHSLNDLPLALNFPWNGDKVDALKVCLLNADGEEICCKVIQFDAPPCVGVSCGIFDLEVKTGDCFSNGTYEVWINFQTPANTLNKFGVWSGTGKFLGFFSTANLPIYIKNFPASGNSTDKVIVCFNSACCETLEFNAPDCASQPCNIVDLVVDVGDCTSDSTYKIAINFHLSGPVPGVNLPFTVSTTSGQFLGTFNTADLPITILNFPWSGNSTDAIKICVGNSVTTYCCKVKEFKAPACLGDPCGIFNLKVETGDCNADGTYQIWVNFQSTASLSGAFGVWAGNGTFLGVYSVNDLPVHIKNFPGSGNPVDVVKVCLIGTTAGTPLCCRTKEFKAPDCSGNPCGLNDLEVKVGNCTSDKTYEVWVSFKVNTPSNTTKFELYANGTLFGTYPLSALPLYIPNFPWNGGNNDVVKVCIVSPLTVICCETLEFKVPDCLQSGPCEIYDFKVDPGGCTSDKTYKLYLNFKVHNPGSATHFAVWANGTLFGTYPLSALPLTIQNFPWGGGSVDAVKVCLVTSNVPTPNQQTCCAVKEFHVPDCLTHQCEIYDLKVETGDCNPDGTYHAWINFKVQNPPALSTHFGVWANGQLLGFFPLTQLPLHIPNFPTNGGPNDVVKICLSNTGATGCCAVKEFPVPNCTGTGCEIKDLKVEIGDCNSDGTYHAWVKFTAVTTSANAKFGLWANGQFIGNYSMADLPVHIPNFPANSGPNDVVKVCILGTSPNVPALCCKTIEFPAPDCSNHPCEIVDLEVQTGDCNPDGTYHAWVDFKVSNNTPVGLFFGLWANGEFLGSFPLTAVPYHIEHFPTDVGPNDLVKVCLVTPNSTQPLCCKTIEFPVPDCLGGDCKITDLQVLTTPCLCGQFFALITFEHKNGGSDGFDIVGNGHNYGNFPYNKQQPIIIGPLDGDGMTEYEFVVKDHLYPDCHDAFDLGTVDCMDQIVARTTMSNMSSTGKLALAPNPTSSWLSVTAQLNSGSVVGQATAEIRQADGRLVRTIVVPNGSNFQLDVAELPSGLYRLSLQTAESRLESTFAKQ